ncbi:hypothetical protein GCM10010221_68800 [Streptomyces parvus]|nr:hypothetical protein GCM10010221_68800 [Streptomyces parvus]
MPIRNGGPGGHRALLVPVRAPAGTGQPQQPPHWHGAPDWQPHPQPAPHPQAPSKVRCTTSVGVSCWGSVVGESAMVPPQGIPLGGGRLCAAAGDVRHGPPIPAMAPPPAPLHAHPGRRINGAHVQERMCGSRTPVSAGGTSEAPPARPLRPVPPPGPSPRTLDRAPLRRRALAYAPSTGAAAWISSACSPVTR